LKGYVFIDIRARGLARLWRRKSAVCWNFVHTVSVVYWYGSHSFTRFCNA